MNYMRASNHATPSHPGARLEHSCIMGTSIVGVSAALAMTDSEEHTAVANIMAYIGATIVAVDDTTVGQDRMYE